MSDIHVYALSCHVRINFVHIYACISEYANIWTVLGQVCNWRVPEIRGSFPKMKGRKDRPQKNQNTRILIIGRSKGTPNSEKDLACRILEHTRRSTLETFEESCAWDYGVNIRHLI